MIDWRFIDLFTNSFNPLKNVQPLNGVGDIKRASLSYKRPIPSGIADIADIDPTLLLTTYCLLITSSVLLLTFFPTTPANPDPENPENPVNPGSDYIVLNGGY